MKRLLLIGGILFLSFSSCATDTNNKKTNTVHSEHDTTAVSLKESDQKTETKDLISDVDQIRNENEETNLIILGGGTTQKDAEKVKQQYDSSQSAFNDEVRGIATISLSDTITGLNKGFYIATIGCVNNNFRAQMITRYANLYVKGVYSRKVKLKKEQFVSIGSKIDFNPSNRDDLDLLPKLMVDKKEETGDCSFENYQEFCSSETCVYESGIIKIEQKFYEAYEKQIKYPLEVYDFHEVLDHLMYKREAFTQLLDYNNLEDLEKGNYKNAEDEEEAPEIKVLENQEIEISGSHYGERISIQGNYIVYYYSSGA